MKTLLHLTDPVTAHAKISGLWGAIKASLMGGQPLEIEVRPERRNTAQNALYHALLSDIANQKEWAGQKRSMEVWKRLITAAWLRARGESVEILPAIDGHGIDVVFRRTSELTKAEFVELVEFTTAWAAENVFETC